MKVSFSLGSCSETCLIACPTNPLPPVTRITFFSLAIIYKNKRKKLTNLEMKLDKILCTNEIVLSIVPRLLLLAGNICLL